MVPPQNDEVLSWLGMEGYSMNDRILELAKQAGLKKAHGADREYIGDFDWRYFAELIVAECAQFVEDKFDFVGDEIVVKEKMLDHFGVEE
jgi:hypothetical protein